MKKPQVDPEKLNKQIENIEDGQQQTYECNGCKGTFLNTQMEYETLPDNFMIVGYEKNQGVPKCPHCGYLGFFGFEVIDIAF